MAAQAIIWLDQCLQTNCAKAIVHAKRCFLACSVSFQPVPLPSALRLMIGNQIVMPRLSRTLEPEVMDTVEEAVDYDSMDHSEVNRQFVDDLLAFVNKTKSALQHDLGVTIDLGTGTALIPKELMSRQVNVELLLACDLSWEMLRLAHQHLSAAKRLDSALPVLCDAKELPCADQTCDVVISNSIVHHIPEPKSVFREMRRIVQTGGIIFVRDLMRPESEMEVEELVLQYAGSENAHQQQMFRQSLHAALTVDEVSQLLADCDLPGHWVSATTDRHWTVAGQMP